jgi:hypothetical protein
LQKLYGRKAKDIVKKNPKKKNLLQGAKEKQRSNDSTKDRFTKINPKAKSHSN